MKVKEFYYESEMISEIRNSLPLESSSIKRTSDRLYCFLIKNHFKAENVVIDYQRKIAFLQFSHSNPQVTDDKILVANTRIVEVHYTNLKTLLLACIKKNERNLSFYNQVKGFSTLNNKSILTSKN